MRSILATIFIAFIILMPPAFATDPVWEDTGALNFATSAAVVPVGKIREIRAPVLGAPAITTTDATFPVEVVIPETSLVTNGRLVATAGGADTCALTVTETGAGLTRRWADTPALRVRHFDATVPATCPVGLYDLELTVSDLTFRHGDEGGLDAVGVSISTAAHSVSVMDRARWDALASGAAEPRFVVLADPQVADPRALQDGATASASAGAPQHFFEKADGVLGDGSDDPSGRWKAFHASIAEIARLDIDFVLIAGDLGFAQLIPGSYAAEYEEIYRMLLTIPAPIFPAPGNHDGYASNGQDGFAYWRAYIGPMYFSAPATPGTEIFVLNTYDWSEMDRIGVSLAVSSWGGQMRGDQLAWLASALTTTRAGSPDARIISVSHHSPSWVQDPYRQADPTGMTARVEGLPAAEQVTRGAVSVATTDQGWSGDGRLALRDLLRDADVEIAFAGHIHHDRVARDDGTGRIVETHARGYGRGLTYDRRELHYIARDDTLVTGHSQSDLVALMRAGTGPLYVDTTSVMSDTDEYWGYRYAEIAYDAFGDLELARLGYAMTPAELADLGIADRYNADHASLGLFSTPLHVERGPLGEIGSAFG